MKGETDGVFQLESSGMKEILVSMKPDCIEDVMALIALYRPGPLKMVPEFISRKPGKTKIVYEVPRMEGSFKETYGVILYQEQVMQIASALASYTMGEADTFRKHEQKEGFRNGEGAAQVSGGCAPGTEFLKPWRNRSLNRWKPLRATVSTNRTALPTP